MKKLILLFLFLIVGSLSFSALDKIVIAIPDNDYEHLIITGTKSRGKLANTLFGGKKDKDFGKDLYIALYKSNKLTFIIEKYDGPALANALTFFEKEKFYGNIEIIEISEVENENIKKLSDKNKWIYSRYSSTSDIKGTVKIHGNDTPKSKYIGELLQAKKELK